MRAVKVALVGSLAVVAVSLVLVLLGSPMSVAGTNRIAGDSPLPIATTEHSASYCQADEVVPQGTSAVRVWLDAAAGPRVALLVSAGGHTVLRGTRGSNWTGGSVTVPVREVGRRIAQATVCVSFKLGDETVIAEGEMTPAASAAQSSTGALHGRIWIEYLRPGAHSWASLIPTVVDHMALGRATSGSWIVFVALAMLLTCVLLGSDLLRRELS
jgi:hypothetical protein